MGFGQLCEHNDWYPAFYQVLSDDLSIYRASSFHSLQIGEEAIVELKDFTTQGKAGKNLRTAVNRLTKTGYEVKFYQPPIPDDLLRQLKTISDEWLQMMQGSEKQFSLGWFDAVYLKDCEIAVVQNSNGQISAFANVVPKY